MWNLLWDLCIWSRSSLLVQGRYLEYCYAVYLDVPFSTHASTGGSFGKWVGKKGGETEEQGCSFPFKGGSKGEHFSFLYTSSWSEPEIKPTFLQPKSSRRMGPGGTRAVPPTAAMGPVLGRSVFAELTPPPWHSPRTKQVNLFSYMRAFQIFEHSGDVPQDISRLNRADLLLAGSQKRRITWKLYLSSASSLHFVFSGSRTWGAIPLPCPCVMLSCFGTRQLWTEVWAKGNFSSRKSWVLSNLSEPQSD